MPQQQFASTVGVRSAGRLPSLFDEIAVDLFAGAGGMSLIIGHRYAIPTVELTARDGGWFLGLRPGTHLPVLGPLHDDAAIIGFAESHWHIDFRFVTERIWAEWGKRFDGGHANVHGMVIREKNTTGTVTIRRLRCRRPMPTFPTEYISIWDPRPTRTKAVPWLPKLEAAFANHTLKADCAVCPHRGLPLDGLPARNGVIVCPGHGLAWNRRTGRLVRRTTAGGAS